MSIPPKLQLSDYPVTGFRNWSGSGVAVWWLGQAGFILRYGNTNIVIDAYLSDFLAVKYRGQEFSHKRMMPPPISMQEMTGIDFFICSHSHSDHMDPGLIPVIRDISPDCRFIIPEAVRTTGLERGMPGDRILGIDAGEDLSLGDGISLKAIPSAHEELKQDSLEHHYSLGFILGFGNLSVYHSGDCLPYPGYDTWLKSQRIDLALMPVNGRRDELSRRGIAGNFSFTQACTVVLEHDIPFMIPHHYGMFDFNTVDRAVLDAEIKESDLPDRIFPGETDILYNLCEDGCG